MPKLHSLACPNCGAKLRWNGEVSVVECRYCETHVAVDTGGRTDRPTDVVSIPPSRRNLIIAMCAVAVAGLVVSVFVTSGAKRTTTSRPPPPPPVTSTVAQVVSTPIAATAKQVAAHHEITAGDRVVQIRIAGARFREIVFTWEPEHPEHVAAVSLTPAKEGDALADVIARALAVLGRRLRLSGSSHHFQGGGAQLSIGTSIHLGVHPEGDPRWKERFAAIWSVAVHAAFETTLSGDAAQRHDLLDLGYPLATLGQVALDTGIDTAASEMKRIAPNVASEGAKHQVMIDHPWFERATLDWDNQPGGVWTSIILYLPAELTLAKIAEPLTACLRPVAGEANKLVADHLAGTFNLQYPAKRGKPWLDIGERTIQIHPHYTFGEKVTAKGLADVIAALAACR